MAGPGGFVVAQRCSNRQSVVSDTAIEAQWSHHGLLMLLKPTRLNFFPDPPTGGTMLFGDTNQSKRGLAETLDHTNDSENEETEDEEWHRNILLDNERDRTLSQWGDLMLHW